MPEDVIRKLINAIISLDDNQAKLIAQEGIAEGIDPLDMINEGIRKALDNIGVRFASGELFLPELMLSAKAADAAMEVLQPELFKNNTQINKLGKFLIATVKGDVHDIGKNIVSLMMKSAGFEVYDIGVDKSVEEILEAAKAEDVDVIGLSALLTTTMLRMRDFMELLTESGLRDKFKVIIGGAPVNQEFSDKIGADGFAADAVIGVELTKKLLGL